MPLPSVQWDGTGTHAAEIVTALRADGYAAHYRPAINDAPPRLVVLDRATGSTAVVDAIRRDGDQ